MIVVDKTLSKLSSADREMVTRQQLLEHRRVILSGTIANFIAAVFLTVSFYKIAPTAIMIFFWIIYIPTAIHRLLLSKRLNSNNDNASLLKIKRRLSANIAVNAYLWGAGTAALLSIATQSQSVILVGVAAGIIGVGAIAFRCMPDATRAWLTILPVSFAIGLLNRGDFTSWTMLTMLIIYAYLLFVNNCRIFEGYVELLLSRQEIEDSSETVKLLLNDFEEQSSNWLFAIDQHGRLVNACERFARAANIPADQLNGRELITLFEEGDNRDALAGHLSNQRSFRDLSLITSISGKQKCWTISGRVAKNDGQFHNSTDENRIVLRGVIVDVTAQKDAESRANYLMRFDSLTDLPNRRLFSETLSRAMRNAQNTTDGDSETRPCEKIALLLFNVDHFQAVNDNHGHANSDKILWMIARRCSKFVEPDDMLARTGGDEFSLLLTGERADRAEEISAEIVKNIENAFRIDGHLIYLKYSVGIAFWDNDDYDLNELVRNANLALKTSKAAGRNRITCFEEGLHTAAAQRQKLEQELIASLENDQMKVFYQPVIDLTDGEKMGYEALVRWDHPENGLIMPNNFIPLAEETGLIVHLGEWVIRTAIADAAAWPNQNMVAVNLSPVQMRSPNLVPTVVNALAANNFDPARLELEITENTLMNDSDSNLRTLHSLRELGVRISLDDFGTGYSSLNYLRAFPFDKIKIDRCFVSEIDSRDDCRAIVRSVIDLARSLGMQTTAEGVERESQAQQLIAEGCDQVQGYLYGKAAPLKSDHLPQAAKPVVPGGFKKPRALSRRRKAIKSRKRA